MAALLSPEQVCDLIPGMTKKKLENMRGAKIGPRYFKPSQKTVVYREDDILKWLETTAVKPVRGAA